MTAGGPSEGLGRPSTDQPGFAPPPGQLPPQGPPEPPQWPPQQPPQQWPPQQPPRQVPPQQWAPPDQRALVPAPPTGRGPRQPRRTRLRLVAGLLAGSLVLGAILSTLPLLPVGRGPAPEPTQVPLVTATPTAQPTAASTASAGGDLGRSIQFRSGPATGTVIVHSATWTDVGELAPEPGHRYLVLDVSVACSSGSLPVDAVAFLASSGDGPELPAFGPRLASPLGGRLLASGEQVRGELGYSVVPGEVTLRLLDPDLRPVAEARIPAP